MNADWKKMLDEAVLQKQIYGIASAQGAYGSPRGIWLECTGCNESQVIAGSRSYEWKEIPTALVAKVFTKAGWTGEGENLIKAKCPACSKAKK